MYFAHGEPVTVWTATTTTDRYGNEVNDWVVGPTYDRCSVAPRASTELTDGGRQGVIIGLSVYLPPDAVVGPHDRLEVRGDMFEIDGEPGEWRSPFTGWNPGIEVALKRVTG